MKSKNKPVVVPDPFGGVSLLHASECLRALAHPARLRIVAVLLKERIAVGELAKRLRIAQPRVSGHVRILQSRGMLVGSREGNSIYYTVANPALKQICGCIRTHFADCPFPVTASRSRRKK